MLVGNLEADYVGDENCLKNCHAHDKLAKDFKLSVHGDQISTETGLPLVNCESCHGPGSLAIATAVEKKTCDFKTLLPISEFPAQAQAMTLPEVPLGGLDAEPHQLERQYPCPERGELLLLPQAAQGAAAEAGPP